MERITYLAGKEILTGDEYIELRRLRKEMAKERLEKYHSEEKAKIAKLHEKLASAGIEFDYSLCCSSFVSFSFDGEEIFIDG